MREIEHAFEIVKRQDFLPDEVRHRWREDTPLPIGFGQTNSQPSTVARMLEWLEVEPGQRILDIGSGSGWTTALLAQLVGPKGTVYAVETIPELVRMGRENCRRLGIENVVFKKAGRRLGLPRLAPYDRILVSAGAEVFPYQLLEQLSTPGKMVVPVGLAIEEVYKDAVGHAEEYPHYGYLFVPLVTAS